MSAFEKRPCAVGSTNIRFASNEVLIVECRSGETRWVPYRLDPRAKGTEYSVSVVWGAAWQTFDALGRGRGKSKSWCFAKVGVDPAATAREHKKWAGYDGSGLTFGGVSQSGAVAPSPTNRDG